MKINRVSANKKTFKEVVFESNFNAVVAETSNESTDKDSRNGLGKTLLVKIINYCLGSNRPSDLEAEELAEWSFTVEFEINGNVYEISRDASEISVMRVKGPYEELGLPQTIDGGNEYSAEVVKAALGKAIFGLDPKAIRTKKNAPSYRSLMSYFIRTDPTAFSDPFAFFSRQQAWTKQVHNAYLLGLDWDLSSKMTLLNAKLEVLDKANKAIAEGAFEDFGGTIGELETDKINLETKLDEIQLKLRTFKVHEQYYDIQQQADDITKKIHGLLNAVNLNEQIITKYSVDLKSEDDQNLDVKMLYQEVNVVLPDNVVKHLDDVVAFHRTITKDRADYLKSEVAKLKREVMDAKDQIAELSDRKSEFMEILSSYGALDEFSLLQNEVNNQKAKVEDVRSKINRLIEVEDSMSRTKVEIEDLSRSMRKDHSQRLPSLALAIKLFNENSEYMYSKPGKLSIDTSKSGYKFKIEIERSNSAGVGSMKVFCYDLMLAELWATAKNQPVPLIHDSRLFDGVDDRQITKALELAYKKSHESGFQYICTLNSDQIPYTRFSEGFKEKFDDAIKVKYSDIDETGTLLGIIF